MSTIVCQGLPSFLDSQLNDSRTLLLKLASPRSHLSHSLETAFCTVLDSDSKILFRENGDHINNSSTQRDGLSFLQALPNLAQLQNERQSAYVHPLVKRASSVLSDKSLELCTENLGSETGTDVIEDENNIFSGVSCSEKNHSRKTHVGNSRRTSTKMTFPPPLSTMVGSETVQVRPVRENGRLILKAVKVQPAVSCFQADRSNGRLLLRLVDAENSSSSDHLSLNDQKNTEATRDDSGCVGIRSDNMSESAVGNWQGRWKEGESGNTQGLLLEFDQSVFCTTSC